MELDTLLIQDVITKTAWTICDRDLHVMVKNELMYAKHCV